MDNIKGMEHLEALYPLEMRFYMSKEKCVYVENCGACHLGQKTYEDELIEKKKVVEKYVGKYCKVNDVAGMYYPYHYRNKVHAVFGRNKDEVIAGTYAERTHTIVPIKDCQIEDAQASAKSESRRAASSPSSPALKIDGSTSRIGRAKKEKKG